MLQAEKIKDTSLCYHKARKPGCYWWAVLTPVSRTAQQPTILTPPNKITFLTMLLLSFQILLV